VTIKIKPWLIYATLIALGVLLFASMRGCHQGQSAVAASIAFGRANDSLINVTKILRVVIDSTKKGYQDSLDFVNGQLALKNNQLVSTKYSLDSADQRITALIDKHKDIQPNKDTTVTIVPNNFITECHECFTELKGGQEKVKLYISQLDSVKQVTQNKLNLQQNRINQLDQQNIQLSGTLQDCLEISKTAQKKLAPHGMLYFSWNLLWQTYWPHGFGMGLIYRNKYNVEWGGKYYFTNSGSMVETEVNLPLTFLIRK
jgi:hypothetical protein